MEYHKSGNIGGAVGAIISLIVGVGVSVMVLIFVGLMGGQTFSLQEPKIATISKHAITGESHTSLIGVATQLDHKPLWTGTLSITNASTAVGSGNYTIDTTLGTYTLVAASKYNNTALTSAYTYGNQEIQGGIRAAIVSGFSALQNTGDYLPIIVLAVVITMVLALVLSFRGLNGGSSGTAL